MSEFRIGIWTGFGVAALASILGNVVGHISSKRLRPTSEWVKEIMDNQDN